MEVLTSRNNETVKAAAALKNADARREQGLFLLEGARLCYDAVRSGIKIEKAFMTENAMHKYTDECMALQVSAEKTFLIAEALSDRLADTKNPQGVFCVCKTLDKTNNIDKIKYNGIYALADGLQNPDNLGALARTAEALGADGLLLCGGCDLYSPKAMRASMGSLLRLDVFVADDALQLVHALQGKGLRVFASVVDSNAAPVQSVIKGEGCVVVIGNEGNGVSDAVIAAADERITIPMAGRAESLNAAAAAAILLWEFLK
ncbi:MAG: RNA methyltransferase [Ruminococcaceae bacterium]|nr:RNA methyltransferase [Oscillospiraceae bacterium]